METTKTVTRYYAVLKEDWNYVSYGGPETIEKGRRFDTGRKGNGVYINKEGNLILPHWFGYGQAELIPADHIDIFEEVETTVTTKTTTAKKVLVEGGKYVDAPVKKTGRKG